MTGNALDRFNEKVDSGARQGPYVGFRKFKGKSDFTELILDGRFTLEYLLTIVNAWEELIRETHKEVESGK